MQAQTCCSAGVPISTFMEIASSEKNSFSIQLNHEYRSINWLVDNNTRLENDPRSRYGQNTSLKFDYSLNSKWAFSALIPFVHHSRNTTSESQNSFGLGDLGLLMQYNVLSKSLYSLNVVAGIDLPIGNTSHRGSSQILLSPDMQSGSGSMDFLVGTSYAKTDFLLPFLSHFVIANYRWNGTNDSFGSTANFNGRSFAFGDEFMVVTGFRYMHTLSAGFLIPDAGVRIRWQDPNSEQGADAPNSGGRWLSLPFGLSFVPDKSKSIRLYTELPIYQNLNGLQITTNFTVGIQFIYTRNRT
ncbi:MAG: hypothetical protein AAGA77_00090 [Bacteroidota bacterium]